jgi:hypothetical protein
MPSMPREDTKLMPFKSSDIAYFAGLFEGEGTVFTNKFYWNKDGVKHVRKSPQTKIRIAMTDKEPLERIVNTIGGRINGPYRYGKENYKPFWILDIDSPTLVRELANLMAEYLSPRRKEQLEGGLYHSI